ncbi:MAG: hypothetical protein B7Y07_05780 [Halothiobacillus sp. 24-54-40]|jgi:hypothetical protein|nr:MAG: hypothetical protein B7Y07_05780 [Halothiobacillus sp. 24-54-40]OZA80408.1 MAG: hypothetical protein B7X64_06065 [Halothiobacillus sp. 39-53-45]HQS03439.1 hypothetical protein [Halothiobacillus sp.]
MRIVETAFIVFFAACAGQAAAQDASLAYVASQAPDPAAALVHKFRLGSNLESMANSTAALTETYHMLSALTVTSEIHRLVPKYQPQWDANLAKAYAAHLSPAELQSLVQLGKSSPYVSKLKQEQPAIGTDMKTSSTPILKALVTEALSNVAKQ